MHTLYSKTDSKKKYITVFYFLTRPNLLLFLQAADKGELGSSKLVVDTLGT
jgi:hypothetical protein